MNAVRLVVSWFLRASTPTQQPSLHAVTMMMTKIIQSVLRALRAGILKSLDSPGMNNNNEIISRPYFLSFFFFFTWWYMNLKAALIVLTQRLQARSPPAPLPTQNNVKATNWFPTIKDRLVNMQSSPQTSEFVCCVNAQEVGALSQFSSHFFYQARNVCL